MSYGGGYDGGRGYQAGGAGGYGGGGGGGSSYGGGGGGGGGYGGGNYNPPAAPVTDDQIDTIYVNGLPSDVTEQEMIDFFGGIGLIKKKKKNEKDRVKTEMIWLYKDKATGLPKGDATVTYQDPETAAAAVKWLNGADFKIKNVVRGKLDVSLSTWQKNKVPPPGGYPVSNAPYQPGGSGGGGRGGGGEDRGGGGGAARAPDTSGDWPCETPGCNNVNFARRMECNRCKQPRPAHTIPEGMGRGRGRGGGGRDDGGREPGGGRGGGGGGGRDDSGRDGGRGGGREDRDRERGGRDDRDKERDGGRDRGRDDRDRGRDRDRDRGRDRSRSPRR